MDPTKKRRLDDRDGLLEPKVEVKMEPIQLPQVGDQPGAEVKSETPEIDWPEEKYEPEPLKTNSPFPANLFHDVGHVVDHPTADCFVIKSAASKWIDWKCLVPVKTLHRDHKEATENIRDCFPAGTKVHINAVLIDRDKPVQYIATLSWDLREVVLSSHNSKSFEIQPDLNLYHNMPAKRTPLRPVLAEVEAKVSRLVDDAGVLEVGQSQVLFRSESVQIGGGRTLTEGQRLDRYMTLGDIFCVNAVLVHESSPIPYFATAVWKPNPIAFHNLQPIYRREDLQRSDFEKYERTVARVQQFDFEFKFPAKQCYRLNVECKLISRQSNYVIAESTTDGTRCFVPIQVLWPIKNLILNDTVIVNQALIREGAPVPYLATSGWQADCDLILPVTAGPETFKIDVEILTIFHEFSGSEFELQLLANNRPESSSASSSVALKPPNFNAVHYLVRAEGVVVAHSEDGIGLIRARENFALVCFELVKLWVVAAPEDGKDLALFCQLSAVKVDEKPNPLVVFAPGTEVVFNAVLFKKKLRVPYFATRVWTKAGHQILEETKTPRTLGLKKLKPGDVATIQNPRIQEMLLQLP